MRDQQIGRIGCCTPLQTIRQKCVLVLLILLEASGQLHGDGCILDLREQAVLVRAEGLAIGLEDDVPILQMKENEFNTFRFEI